MQAAAVAFDRLAVDYDRVFTERRLGRALRATTWAAFDAAFPARSRVLDIGCGTGEDALHLAARGVAVTGIDPAPAMIRLARDKAARASLAVEFDVLAAETLDRFPDRSFDGAYSNFGALNCVMDLPKLASGLGRLLAPGSRAVFVVMGPGCAWDWLELLRGRPRRALFRLRATDGRAFARVAGLAVPVTYPSPARLLRHLGPNFRARSLSGLGLSLPPSWAAERLEPRPRLVKALDAVDRSLGRLPGAWALADHYVLEVVRCAT